MIRDNDDGSFTVIENGENKGTFANLTDAAEASCTNSGRTGDQSIHELENQSLATEETQNLLGQILNIFGGR
jgi:hypothetical protein